MDDALGLLEHFVVITFLGEGIILFLLDLNSEIIDDLVVWINVKCNVLHFLVHKCDEITVYLIQIWLHHAELVAYFWENITAAQLFGRGEKQDAHLVDILLVGGTDLSIFTQTCDFHALNALLGGNDHLRKGFLSFCLVEDLNVNVCFWVFADVKVLLVCFVVHFDQWAEKTHVDLLNAVHDSVSCPSKVYVLQID